jgi:hypothetical protein
MMPLREHLASAIWHLLEQLYLASPGDQDKYKYAGSTENQKRIVLKDFAKTQAVKSKRWAKIAQDLCSAELESECRVGVETSESEILTRQLGRSSR